MNIWCSKQFVLHEMLLMHANVYIKTHTIFWLSVWILSILSLHVSKPSWYCRNGTSIMYTHTGCLYSYGAILCNFTMVSNTYKVQKRAIAKYHQKLQRVKTILGTSRSRMQRPTAACTRAQTWTRTCPYATCIWLLHPAPTSAQDGLDPVCNLHWWCLFYA